MTGVNEQPRAEGYRLHEAPIDILSRRLSLSGMSLELTGFVWTAVLAILDWGEPLPSDCRKAMVRVGVGDVRRYSRLVTEAVAAEMLIVLDTGEITSTLHSEFRSAKSKRQRPSGRKAIPQDIRQQVFSKTNGKCVYCAVELSVLPGLPTSFHADHVLPVTKGGSDDVANLIPSCAQCNTKKSAKTALVFLAGPDGAIE